MNPMFLQKDKATVKQFSRFGAMKKDEQRIKEEMTLADRMVRILRLEVVE